MRSVHPVGSSNTSAQSTYPNRMRHGAKKTNRKKKAQMFVRSTPWNWKHSSRTGVIIITGRYTNTSTRKQAR